MTTERANAGRGRTGQPEPGIGLSYLLGQLTVFAALVVIVINRSIVLTSPELSAFHTNADIEGISIWTFFFRCSPLTWDVTCNTLLRLVINAVAPRFSTGM